MRATLRWCLAAAALLALLLPSVWPGAIAAGGGGWRYFPETGCWVGNDFLDFFEARGGLDIFGFPIENATMEAGVGVQYFQRVRMEIHPEQADPYRVQLGLLGQQIYGRIDPPVPTSQHPAPGDRSHRYFPETGQVVSFAFLDYFNSRGGLDIFGYPVSSEIAGQGITVQYFQRARMEWRPRNAPPYRVQLGLLGAEVLNRRVPAPPTPTQPMLVTPEPTRPAATAVPKAAMTAVAVPSVQPSPSAAAGVTPAGAATDRATSGPLVDPAPVAILVILLLLLILLWRFGLARRLAGLAAPLRSLAGAAAILAAIAYLTLLGLLMASRGRQGLPADPLNAAAQALGSTLTYLTSHPSTYYWTRQIWPAWELVLTLFARSAGLLVAALGAAAALGVPLGILLAMGRRRAAAPVVLLVSILGISTPSFLLGMLFWVLDIQLYQLTGAAPLQPTGFGWDDHMVLPALVLAARPLAQVVQITYVALSDVLGQDYIRTARAKGLRQRWIIIRHALRNSLAPILTTLGASLRFSLASLPVVEVFFAWPGVGLALWTAIGTGADALVADLVVSLGLFFLLINMGLATLLPVIAPQTRELLRYGEEQQHERTSPRVWLADARDAVLALPARVRALSLRRAPASSRAGDDQTPSASAAIALPAPPIVPSPAPGARRLLLGNPMLLAGGLMVLALFGLALFGERLSAANPYETHGIMYVGEQIQSPPFAPSAQFPWGSDPVGRDVQALVLAGAKQTLAMALFATLARVLLGGALGLLAGWWHGSRLDGLVTNGIAVWAAFPVTLFAMILIQAMGIQEGLGIFVVALSLVGWGEIAQFVRSQVITVKPQLYIEAARTLGARSLRILGQHVLPQLGPSLLVLAVMEMGGVLMLLAELGFLNVFLGGGFRVQIAEGARMSPIMYYFSDVPEWAALLANIRNWWRSYPWMAWYPGVCFFLAILTFNVAGEGLRRLMDDARVNVGRIFNRYTLGIVLVLVAGLAWVLRTNTPVEVYRAAAGQFSAESALADIRALASPDFQGRETGTPGARAAAEFIARRMAEVGLLPAGENNTYLMSYPCPRAHLSGLPALSVLDGAGKPARSLVYRQDFVEYVFPSVPTFGANQGAVIGLALGADPETGGRDAYGIANLDVREKVLIVHSPRAEMVNPAVAAGLLVVADDPTEMQRRRIFSQETTRLFGPETSRARRSPVMYITPQLADELLATAGISLRELDALTARLEPGQVGLTGEGAAVSLSVPVAGENLAEMCYHAVGFLPGAGSDMKTAAGKGLDDRVILVGAYYDGLGQSPEGTVYPGANDNASGVAAMLEMARQLKASPYQPKKTVVFAAWAEGERGESLSVINLMNGKPGFGLLTVEAVLELGGLGAGDGNSLALGAGSSYRLVQLYQEAAGRFGVEATTRGRGPHYGWPVRGSFGGRTALTLSINWDGSDRQAHTPADRPESIDPGKLRRAGQSTLLALTVLSREVDY